MSGEPDSTKGPLGMVKCHPNAPGTQGFQSTCLGMTEKAMGQRQTELERDMLMVEDSAHSSTP